MKKLIFIALAFLVEPCFATTNKMSYGSNNQALSIAANIATNIQSASASVDNTANLFLDAFVMCVTSTTSAGFVSTSTLNVYAYGTANGGTSYSDAVSGSSATVTLSSPPNVRFIGVCNTVANSTPYYCGPYSIGLSFGGFLPDHWGIVAENKGGGSLNNTACFYQGVYIQSQ